MKLTILNGSPRGKNSNSSHIIQWLTEDLNIEHEIFYLNNVQKHDDCLKHFVGSDCAIIVFPLYTDAMPGLVMAFIEKLEQIKRPLANLKLGFIIHSGFPGAYNSRYVERYMVSLTKQLGADYIGTAIMPGSEGIRNNPGNFMFRKNRNLFRQLGKRFTEIGRFDDKILKNIAGTERMSELALIVYRLVLKLGLADSHWSNKLKSNNAYHLRFDKPYAD